MHNNSNDPFYIGDWCVIPEQCQLQNSHGVKHLQPKLMEVLLFLSDHLQHVQSTDDLIQACWAGQPMTDNPIHKTIAQLRKALGDSSDVPKYIKTIPRKGYMMIAKVSRGIEKRSLPVPFWRDQAPFMGLHSFQQHHKDIFFGREQPMADFLKFIERIDQSDTLLIVLSGSSGCGKSSFIQAGIIPKLLNPYKPFKFKIVNSLVWRVEQDSCAVDLLTALHSNGMFEEVMTLDALTSAWVKNPAILADFLRTDEPLNNRSVVFIDQVEKLWLNQTNQITALLKLIVQLNLSKRFLLIVSARDEALIAMKQLPAFKPLISHTLDFRLGCMQSTDHIEWVEATTHAAGLFFEVNPNRKENLFDLIKHSIARYKNSLSAIQTVMQKLYENRDNSTLQYASFHELGGFEGILNNYLEETFGDLTQAQQQTIINLLPKLIKYQSMVDQRVVNRNLTLRDASTDLGITLLNRLIDQRWFQSVQSSELVTIKFNEPRMAQLWQRLVEWIVVHQSSLIKSSELHFLTLRWMRSDLQTACLIGKQQHAQMKALEQLELLVVNEDQELFLNASQAAIKSRRSIRAVATVGVVLMLFISTWLTIGWQLELKDHQITQDGLASLSQHLTVDLNPQLKEKGELTLLEGVGLELLQLFENVPPEQLNLLELETYSAALNVLGELSFNQRDYDRARGYFGNSVAVLKPKSTLNNKLIQEMMLSQYWLGYLGFIEKQFVEAGRHWDEYLQTALHLSGLEPQNPQWQLEHSYALNNLGSLSESMGELQAAAEYFAESIAIKTKLLSHQSDDMTLQADLADSLSWQGNIFRKQGLLTQALDAYKNSADLTKKLKSDQNNTNTKLHRESLAIHRMASVTLDLGQVTEAMELASLALEKSLLLAQLEPQNNSYKKELISLYLLNATAYRQQNNFDQSLSHIQKANQLIDYFKMNLTMTAQINTYLMMVKREQAIIFNHFGQTESAITAINEGLLNWQEQAFSNQNLARITFVMLNLDWVKIMKKNTLDPSSNFVEGIELHLDKAWREINSLLAQQPEDAQVMAIILSLMIEKSMAVNEHKFIQLLQDSEYRNPDYYQPLIYDQLISLN